MQSLESSTCHADLECSEREVSQNTESSLDLPLESLSLQPFLQSLHKEQWQEVRLGEVAEITSSKRIFYSEYVEYGIPFYRSKEIIEFSKGNNPQNELFIDENKYNDIANKFGVPQANDILLTSVGTLGIPYLVPKDKKFYFKDGNLTWFKNFKNITSWFLFYWFKSPQGKEKLDSIAIGSTQQALTIQGMKNLIFQLPPLTTQQKIAEILSSLDDKIDLLHRQNKTLESLALTLFRHYFIDNPNRNEWEEKHLSEVAEIGIGRTPPRKEKNWFSTDSRDIKWISIKDMEEKIFIVNTSEFLTMEAIRKFRIPLIPPNTILLSFKMTLGRVGITTENMLSNEAIAHFNLYSEYSLFTEYLYCFLKTFKYEALGSTSSIVTAINSTLIKSINIKIPDRNIMVEFSMIAKGFFDKIYNNTKQIQNLQAMRDMLLRAIFA